MCRLRHLLQVPGRQCLASAALLGPTPAEALPLLESIAEVGCREAARGGLWRLR